MTRKLCRASNSRKFNLTRWVVRKKAMSLFYQKILLFFFWICMSLNCETEQKILNLSKILFKWQTAISWALVVVTWSACSPSALKIQVRIPLKLMYTFLGKICVWNEQKYTRKRPGLAHQQTAKSTSYLKFKVSSQAESGFVRVLSDFRFDVRQCHYALQISAGIFQ